MKRFLSTIFYLILISNACSGFMGISDAFRNYIVDSYSFWEELSCWHVWNIIVAIAFLYQYVELTKINEENPC